VTGPPWTTTVTMSCSEPLPNTYFTTVHATGGGKARDVILLLAVSTAQMYSLSAGVSPAGAGTLVLSPPGGWYTAGSQVTVTAGANAGYQFTGFSGSLSGGSPGLVTMNGNKSVTANFTQSPLSVSPATVTLSAGQKQIFAVTGSGGGNVTWSHSPALGTLTPNGTAVLYTAPANITTTPVTVTATTAYGSASATVNLGTGGQPPTISNIQAPSQYLSTTAATVSWNTSANASSQIYWGQSASYTSFSTLDPALSQSHQQYIVGLSPGTTYHYQVRSTDPSGNLATSQDLMFTTPATLPPVPSEFRSCVQGTGSLCTLNPGTYAVTSTINITRYGVTVSGGATDRKLTRLVRGPNLTEPLIRVAVTDATGATKTMTQAGASQGVVVQNLTLCGGGNTHPNVKVGEEPLASPAVMSPAGSPCGDQHLSPSVCAYGNEKCVDFSVESVAVDLSPASGHYPTNPWTYSGPYALEVNNVDLEDAAGHALSLWTQANTTGYPALQINDVWIHDSAINYSAVTGILYGASYVSYDYKYCDRYAEHTSYAFRDDPSLFAPRNIRIEHNEFWYNNTGAMGGGAVRWVGLRNNKFFANYIMPQDGNWAGGSIGFDPCADTIEIAYNTIVGPNSSTAVPPWGYQPFQTTGALEMYGRNITVHDNTISGHGRDGIGGYSLLGSTISHNHILHDNNWISGNYRSAGIEVGTMSPGAPCDPVPRDTNGVTITANDSNPIDVYNNNAPLPTAPAATQAYGVYLWEYPPRSTGRLSGVTIASDNFQGNHPLFGLFNGVFLDPLVGLYGYQGTPYGNLVLPEVRNPKLLTVDVVDASSSQSSFLPLLPTPPRCADLKDGNGNLIRPLPAGSLKGSPRAKFKFSAADLGTASSLNGASNIAAIWGIFSTGGNDTDGTGGPSGSFCNFAYDAINNLLFVGDGAGGWLTPSVVGAGGQDLLSPGGCIFRAASSEFSRPSAVPVGYVLDLTLDVSLPAVPAKYHIYSYTESLNYLFDACGVQSANCPTWKYSGYWSNVLQ
jgi:hypothetical protein